MNQLLYAAAMPFKRKGTPSMKENEFIMTLSMDLNWFKPETARQFVRIAVENNVISREEGVLKALFDINKVVIPMGFKPDVSIFEEKDVFEQIIDRIIAETGQDKQKIIASVNRKRDETAGLFTIEVLGILAARELGVPVDDLIEKSYKLLLKG